MYPPQSPIIMLVPGDDWSETITIADGSGEAVDLTGWSVTVLEIRWQGRAIALNADLARSGEGIIGFAASEAQTAALPHGLLSTLTLKMRSPQGVDETLCRAGVKGASVPGQGNATVRPAGVRGPRGASLHVVEQPGDLDAGFGTDGDTAIIRSTGDEHQKAGGVWTAMGGSFWGTLLEQAGDAVADAEAAAERAAKWAERPEDDEIPGHPGRFSALHHAARAGGFAEAADQNAQQTAQDRSAVDAAAQQVADDAGHATAAAATVGALEPAITHVDAIRADIETVALRDADIGTVAGRDGDIATVATNLAVHDERMIAR